MSERAVVKEANRSGVCGGLSAGAIRLLAGRVGGWAPGITERPGTPGGLPGDPKARAGRPDRWTEAGWAVRGCFSSVKNGRTAAETQWGQPPEIGGVNRREGGSGNRTPASVRGRTSRGAARQGRQGRAGKAGQARQGGQCRAEKARQGGQGRQGRTPDARRGNPGDRMRDAERGKAGPDAGRRGVAKAGPDAGREAWQGGRPEAECEAWQGGRRTRNGRGPETRSAARRDVGRGPGVWWVSGGGSGGWLSRRPSSG